MTSVLAIQDSIADLQRRAPHHDNPGLREGPVYWGRSAAMAELRRRLSVLARSPLPVVIEGETGTGKSFLAEHVLHARSGVKGPLVVTDLSTIPDSLIPAHLFGTRRGSYTGSVEDQPGVFEQAHEGTLFLDEIASLDPDTQRRLLLVLERGTVTRLGDSRARPAAPRIIAATNLELARLVREGRFRHDVYMRLNPPGRVRVPSLRDRRDDLPDLIRFAFAEAVRCGPLPVAYGREALPVFIPERALRRLLAYDWPGNHRELKLFAINALVLSPAEHGGNTDGGRAVFTVSESVVDELLENVSAPSSPSSSVAAVAGAPGERRIEVSVRAGRTFTEISADVERQYLTALFHAHGGNLDRIAVELFGPGANRRKVHLRMNQLGLRVRGLRGELSPCATP
ncbi:MAG TPA: sigma 54-interacting transcriptional regulator [Myxococcales bacterium]|jgi:DNA-binding NtrC family response regulator|nr:sigma 54-interacting transcriptional regulator [Myxococcales bacterium]